MLTQLTSCSFWYTKCCSSAVPAYCAILCHEHQATKASPTSPTVCCDFPRGQENQHTALVLQQQLPCRSLKPTVLQALLELATASVTSFPSHSSLLQEGVEPDASWQAQNGVCDPQLDGAIIQRFFYFYEKIYKISYLTLLKTCTQTKCTESIPGGEKGGDKYSNATVSYALKQLKELRQMLQHQ